MFYHAVHGLSCWLNIHVDHRGSSVCPPVAGECANILFAEGVQAKQDCVQHTVTEALEHVIEANILLSGLGEILGITQ